MTRDCSSGLICEEDTCVPGGECGQEEFVISALPPNVLITLDRYSHVLPDMQEAAAMAIDDLLAEANPAPEPV